MAKYRVTLTVTVPDETTAQTVTDEFTSWLQDLEWLPADVELEQLSGDGASEPHQVSDETVPECPVCGGFPVILGDLGTVTHYRCRACGWTFSVSR